MFMCLSKASKVPTRTRESETVTFMRQLTNAIILPERDVIVVEV